MFCSMGFLVKTSKNRAIEGGVGLTTAAALA
jgi:hypothetical protein